MRSIPENIKSSVKEKFIFNSMRMARQIGFDNKACWSRHIGTVITDLDGRTVSTGYNGAARGVPHCDSATYIKEYLWPKLSLSEQTKLIALSIERKNITIDRWNKLNTAHSECELVSSSLDGCEKCPRKLLGYGAGERNELCYCAHSEQNAIISARQSLKNCALFNWSPISCVPCTINIIQAGIIEVHFLDEVYDKSSIVLYKFAKIPIFLHNSADSTYI